MISKFAKLLLFLIHTITIILSKTDAKPHSSSSPPQPIIKNCTQTCHGNNATTLKYPFGFSSGCPIQLNCSTNGTMLIGEFPVLYVTDDSITVTVQANCSRPFSTIDYLFTENYAPTPKNGLLLNNCNQTSSCTLPSADMVMANFQSECDINDTSHANTRSNGTVSCYSEDFSNYSDYFMNYTKLRGLECGYFLSSISGKVLDNDVSVSLDILLIKLGWWMKGNCSSCSENADCSNFPSTPKGGSGYSCKCKGGFLGDGFKEGTGCRRVRPTCSLARYLSGKCGGRTRIFVLVGGVVAGASMMVSVGLIICFFRQRRQMKAMHNTKRRLSEATGACTIPLYSHKEIERATSYFAEKQRLGTGAYGTVYAGKLHGDEWVAIKRIKNRDTGIEQVMNEIKLISSISHPNLVRLLGCSIEKGEQILVYEFMPNGTLCQHLQRERGDGLTWPVRLTIATETAEALAHLHNAKPPIYHRDVKSSNILLDYNFKSKVADFGLSRLGTMPGSSHISTAPQGTPGYLDPQYHQDFHLSDKSDVYSFGVVLVEIITAMKVVDFTRERNEVNLAALATDRIATGHLDEIIDPFLEAEKDDSTYLSIHKVAELAFRCLAYHQDLRPSMVEVAAELEQIGMSRWESSEENIYKTSSRGSSCSSSSHMSEKLLIASKRDEQEAESADELQRYERSMHSMESTADTFSFSAQYSMVSEESSSTSNSLMNNGIK